MVFDPVHCLPLLEQKVGALDPAAPLAEWDLPEAFATLRRMMEARMIKAGRREYVQVLRLLETFEMADLNVAVKNAPRMGAIGFDAVKHLVLCQVEKRPPKLDLVVYPYLPRANVGTTSAASYMSLIKRGQASMSDAPQILLDHRLKSLRLPTVLREYNKLARQAAAEGLDHAQFLARLIDLEMPSGVRRRPSLARLWRDRERRMIERRIKAAKFPAVKSPPLAHACMRCRSTGQLRLQGDPGLE